MKYALIIIFLIMPALSCTSITIDYYNSDKVPTSSDVYYIKDIEINAQYTMNQLAGNINRSLMFALQKKHYRVKSYLIDPKIKDNYRYHIALKAYVNQMGSAIDPHYSIVVFFTINDTKMRKEVISVRAACTGCDLLNVDDQIDMLDSIVSEFDTLIKN